MQEPFSTIQLRNAKALLYDMCNDISVMELEKRPDMECICDIIIMRMHSARLPEIFTDQLIASLNRRTVAAILETVIMLEDKIKEVESCKNTLS